MSERCPNAPWWSPGHRFEARYEIEPPGKISSSAFNGPAIVWLETIERMTKRSYVRDVCARCGKTIERSSPQNPTS